MDTIKKKHKVLLPVLIAVAVLLIVGGCLYYFVLRGDDTSGGVAVTTVSEASELGYTGLNARYSGIIQPRDTVAVNPKEGLTVAECYVKAGDTVKAGDPLFRYDVNALTLSYEQLLIDITGLENTIKTDAEQLESLDAKIAKAKESKLYDLKMKRSTVELEKKKAEFELVEKQESAATMKEALDNAEVLSPCDGRIKSVNSTASSASDPYSYYADSSSSSDYITIICGNDYCVKGTVSEQAVFSLQEGQAVTIRSRTDETDVRPGEIYLVNTTETEKNTDSYYYDSGSGESASKYAFYVSVESIDGLIIGQHVYIEMGGTASAEDGAIWLPEYYLLFTDDGTYVYAADANGRIERRAVTLGDYNEETCCYQILAGLTGEDRIAFPDDTVTVGSTVK